MKKFMITSSELATRNEHDTLVSRTTQVEEHARHLETLYYDYTLAHAAQHTEENSQLTERFEAIQKQIRKLQRGLVWACVGLLCSGAAILALCIHMIS